MMMLNKMNRIDGLANKFFNKEWIFRTPSLESMRLMNFYINRIMKNPNIGTMIGRGEDVWLEERAFHPIVAIQESCWAVTELIDELLDFANDLAWDETELDVIFDNSDLYLGENGAEYD